MQRLEVYAMAPTAPTADEVLSWPVTVDVRTAGRAWGLGRDQAYRLAREGRFPVPVLHLGRYLRVTRASVLEALGISEPRHDTLRHRVAGTDFRVTKQI
jgi:predicted DNA-binding transcriptional regulator AlpA